ncbi:aspartate/glutamate racemase family protein [Schnuerera sp.]|uniref:aspartate/glutamate racemase family protein n=1 Tax=Schnuerera sp. TaxID=2794844 RepID=UPI002C6AFCC1|nr:aspartate/glutamate racemase family protein [Schnuerera sp.]HSH36823.1 aspartate/glutamate racemase family protein [Schnuerera sp.]
MKKIGLLGGMSWESSLEYYKLMNKLVKSKLGGSHSVKCLLHSFDFHEIEELQHRGKWEKLTSLLVKEAENLKKAGADCIVICTNTMHLMASDIEKSTGLKVIHIADVTGDEIIKRNVNKVLLLGTKFTMESSFYKERLEKKGIEVVIPNELDRQIIHDIIYNELILGVLKQESKQSYIKIINKIIEEGIQGVVLGCTEIPMLIKQGDVPVEVFDTTEIHSRAAVDFAIDE